MIFNPPFLELYEQHDDAMLRSSEKELVAELKYEL